MKLYHAAPSPFVRKVHMAALELGLMDRISLVATHVTPGRENDDYAEQVNPLRKIPALETDDGMVLYDSTVICEYLNHLEGSHKLIPEHGAERWRVLTAQTLANGIMEAGVLLRYETFLRPEERRWSVWVDEQWEKISNALAWFDKHSNDSTMTIDKIALACALGYLDFRFDYYMWRERYADLCSWHETVAKTSAYLDTQPS